MALRVQVPRNAIALIDVDEISMVGENLILKSFSMFNSQTGGSIRIAHCSTDKAPSWKEYGRSVQVRGCLLLPNHILSPESRVNTAMASSLSAQVLVIVNEGCTARQRSMKVKTTYKLSGIVPVRS